MLEITWADGSTETIRGSIQRRDENIFVIMLDRYTHLYIPFSQVRSIKATES